MDSLLTDSSKLKLDIVPQYNKVNCNKLIQLQKSMLLAARAKLNLSLPADLPKLAATRKIFLDFDCDFNRTVDSVFQNDIRRMNSMFPCEIELSNGTIRVDFLYEKNETNMTIIATIIHAINTFCHLIPYNYTGLHIYVALDSNERTIRDVNFDGDLTKFFSSLQMQSGAFNVSGYTDRNGKLIVLTRREEIIKLLFHELSHYVGLDHTLLGVDYQVNWAVRTKKLNISESYTEFVAVLLNVYYQSICVCARSELELDLTETVEWMFDVELNYSIYLSAMVLKLYCYNKDTVEDFFNGVGNGNLAWSPIATFEYIIQRTQLFVNICKVLELVGIELRVTKSMQPELIELMKEDSVFKAKLSKMIDCCAIPASFSYLAIDFDYGKL